MSVKLDFWCYNHNRKGVSKMIPQFNSIILDVAVIVVLLAVIALGAFKGIKHVSINFVLFEAH